MKSVFVCAALLLVAMDAPAIAGEQQVPVSYANLNLSTPAGRDALMSRLNLAARRICGPAPIPAERLVSGEKYDRCIKDTVEHALASLPRRMAAQMNGSQPYAVSAATAAR